MIRTDTVFILGAGASFEAGFPLGATLVGELRSALEFEVRHGSINRGDKDVYQHLIHWAKLSGTDAAACLSAAKKLSSAMFSARSIDDAIFTHFDDPLVSVVGKLAITHSILKAESKSATRHEPKLSGAIDLGRLRDTWYDEFASLLFEGLTRTRLEDLFTWVQIVNFNYDRSLVQYLRYALTRRFSIPLEDADRLLEGLSVHSPYGTLGPLNDFHFGYGNDSNAVCSIAPNIRTFHEQLTNRTEIQQIRRAVSRATRVVVLGFGFHSQNMRLLAPEEEQSINTEQIIASAYNFSDPNVMYVRDALRSHLHRDLRSHSDATEAITLDNSLTCVKLIRDHFHRLSS